MRRIATALATIVLIAGTAHAAGNDKGNDRQSGRDKPAAAAQGGQGQSQGMSMTASMRGESGAGNSRTQGQGTSQGNAQRKGQDSAQSNAGREQRGDSAQVDRGDGSAARAERGSDSRTGPAVQRSADQGRGNDNRALASRDGVRIVGRIDRAFISTGSHGLIAGCPPGLARKNPPCVPPGQVRSVFPFGQPGWWGLTRLGDGRYFYDDGYLLRIGPDGRIAGYVPLLGGALAIGNPWPSYYAPVRLPGYYVDYYGLGPYDSYRYADDVIYGVDPETAAITSIVALLTGDDFVVGRPMPPGYGVYNVPPGLRGRYYDRPDAWYRYSDGYIYEIDPETRLIAAAIELLAT